MHEILKRPLITEKGTWLASDRNSYSFLVDLHATKDQIKKAVAEAYSVRVAKVRTQVRKGKTYRTRAGIGKDGDWKKAIVELHPEDKIEIF